MNGYTPEQRTRASLQPGKQARQRAIRDILNGRAGTSQEEIREYLREHGIATSQATLSRDLREMGAVKIPVNGGGSGYRLRTDGRENGFRISRYEARFEPVGNMLVIKTASGSAPGLCVLIDNLNLQEIAGTVAGDDTIFALLRNPSDARAVIDKLTCAH